MHTVLGIDIGGTTTIVVPGDETGLLEEPKSILTEDITSTEKPADHLTGIIEEYSDYNIEGIGIGAAGVINSDSLEIEQSANWDGVSFREIARNLEMGENRINLENDTDASLLGEKKFGTVTDSENTAYLNYGTGLGGSVWKDEALIRGLEPGFWTVNHKLDLEHGGVLNPAEAFCSGNGIEMFVERRTENSSEPEENNSFSTDNLSAETFFEAVRGYDEFAINTYAEIKDINTQLLGGMINNYDLDTLIFDGSVTSNNSFLVDYEYGDVPKTESVQDPDILADKYLDHIDERISLEERMLDIRQNPELKLSGLGEYSVLYGAIATALQNIETEI